MNNEFETIVKQLVSFLVDKMNKEGWSTRVDWFEDSNIMNLFDDDIPFTALGRIEFAKADKILPIEFYKHDILELTSETIRNIVNKAEEALYAAQTPIPVKVFNNEEFQSTFSVKLEKLLTEANEPVKPSDVLNLAYEDEELQKKFGNAFKLLKELDDKE